MKMTGTIMVLLLLVFCSGSMAVQPEEGMVYIPAGEFIMGSDEKDFEKIGGIVAVDETPRRKVNVKAFYMDKYEVTNRQYKEYVGSLKANGIKAFSHYNDEGIPVPDRWSVEDYPEGQGEYPVVDVDWYMANKYCAYAGKRLPTEEEWEKAARGTDGRVYPWGDEYEVGYSNSRLYWEAGHKRPKRIWEARIKKTDPESKWIELPVGTFEKDVSPYGVHDMSGNIMEWTSSLYRPYPGNPLKRDIDNLELYVLRGGST